MRSKGWATAIQYLLMVHVSTAVAEGMFYEDSQKKGDSRSLRKNRIGKCRGERKAFLVRQRDGQGIARKQVLEDSGGKSGSGRTG